MARDATRDLHREGESANSNAAMELTDEQKHKVAAWVEQGAKLSEIQQRLGDECDVRLTYMQVRFLVDDLKLTPKETAPPEPAAPAAPEATPPAEPEGAILPDEVLPPASGRVAVKVDEITRPGAIVSGSVTFSDGKKAGWYLDQMGRLGMVPDEQGYRPPQADIAEFQIALEKELVRLGL